jgi:hypothetical protein
MYLNLGFSNHALRIHLCGDEHQGAPAKHLHSSKETLLTKKLQWRTEDRCDMVNSSWNTYAYTAYIIIVDKKVGSCRRSTINPRKTCLIAYSASTTVVCSPCTGHQNETLKTGEEELPTLKDSTGTYEAYVYSFSLAPSSSFRFPREEVSAHHGIRFHGHTLQL